MHDAKDLHRVTLDAIGDDVWRVRDDQLPGVWDPTGTAPVRMVDELLDGGEDPENDTGGDGLVGPTDVVTDRIQIAARAPSPADLQAWLPTVP